MWIYLGEPMFQDGVVAQAVDEVVGRASPTSRRRERGS